MAANCKLEVIAGLSHHMCAASRATGLRSPCLAARQVIQ